jgi:anti-sigma B factor antagonist
VLRIDLPTAPLALSLLERLWDFRAEVVPLGGGRYQVLVELDGDPAADDRAQEGFARIESWLESAGLDSDEIQVDDRSTPFDIPASKGLICRVKTIALGTNVRVISAEGEIDLQTAPQLDDILRSTDSDSVILDLTDTGFVESTAVSVMVASNERMRDEGRQFSVVAGNPTVSGLLEMTGVDRALDVHRTLAEAIESALDRTVAVEAHRHNESAR